jgi:rhodanese-related sulfurtransferase
MRRLLERQISDAHRQRQTDDRKYEKLKRLSDFGFWILDFGFAYASTSASLERNVFAQKSIRSATLKFTDEPIQNPKSKFQNRNGIIIMRKYISLAGIAVFGLLFFAACQKIEPKTEIGADSVPRVNVENAKLMFDQGDVVFVDTRAEFAYKMEHIKGAINISAETFQTRFAEVPKDKKIITYCSCAAEHTSARAVQILKEKGYTNAYALIGGTQAWHNAGYPMEKSEQK